MRKILIGLPAILVSLLGLLSVNKLDNALAYNTYSLSCVSSSLQYAYNNNAALNVVPPYTISAWVNFTSPNGWNSTQQVVTGRTASNAVNPLYQIGYYQGNAFKTYGSTWASSGGDLYVTTTQFATGTWHHMAWVSVATNNWKLYIDGAIVSSSVATRSPNTTSKTGVAICALDQGTSGVNGYLYGKVDEVKVWNKALTITEINDTLTHVMTASSGLIAYYNFDSTLAADSSGNGYNLTLVNTPTQSSDIPFNDTPAPIPVINNILTTTTPILTYFWSEYGFTIEIIAGVLCGLAFIKLLINLTRYIWSWYHRI